MTKLTAKEVEMALGTLTGWQREGDVIRRTFTFAGFPDAVAFVVRMGFAAEAVDHHPDLLVNYKRVSVTFTTHSEKGLTRKDLDGAQTADAIATAMGIR